MNTALETAIVERLHYLDEPRQAEVLDFVEYLATKSTANWPFLDPARDLARFAGVLQFDEDAVAYQRRIRDSEWP